MEVPSQPTQPTQPKSPDSRALAEKIGGDKVRKIAAVGIAAASLLGISGKPEAGVGIGVELPNPTTEDAVGVGIALSSSESGIPKGMPDQLGSRMKDINAWEVRVGGASVVVYEGSLDKGPSGGTVRTVGVYPGVEIDDFQSRLNQSSAARDANVEKARAAEQKRT